MPLIGGQRGRNKPNWDPSTSAVLYEVSYAIYRFDRSDPIGLHLIQFPRSNFRRRAPMPAGDVWALKSNATKSNNLLTLPLKSTVKQSAIGRGFDCWPAEFIDMQFDSVPLPGSQCCWPRIKVAYLSDWHTKYAFNTAFPYARGQCFVPLIG